MRKRRRERLRRGKLQGEDSDGIFFFFKKERERKGESKQADCKQVE